MSLRLLRGWCGKRRVFAKALEELLFESGRYDHPLPLTLEYDGAIQGADDGMNNRAHVMRRDGHKILILDYKKQVARVVGDNAGDVWDDRVAPRHFDLYPQ